MFVCSRCCRLLHRMNRAVWRLSVRSFGKRSCARNLMLLVKSVACAASRWRTCGPRLLLRHALRAALAPRCGPHELISRVRDKGLGCCSSSTAVASASSPAATASRGPMPATARRRVRALLFLACAHAILARHLERLERALEAREKSRGVQPHERATGARRAARGRRRRRAASGRTSSAAAAAAAATTTPAPRRRRDEGCRRHSHLGVEALSTW